jgi:pimeloyl-ACP methyl ester carboxylesterase
MDLCGGFAGGGFAGGGGDVTEGHLNRLSLKRIPGARLIALDGLGHSPMLEAPDRFYRALDEALGPASAR